MTLVHCSASVQHSDKIYGLIFTAPPMIVFCLERIAIACKGVVARVVYSRFFPDWTKPQSWRLNKPSHTVHATANRSSGVRVNDIAFDNDGARAGSTS
jgi:hypothetical protein